MNDRDLDVVVFGATGITGRGVAAYLAERSAETGARWAPAARNPAKLEQLLGEAGVTAPETIVADLADPPSLAAMAARTKVVLNLVGPYTLYGRPVIQACVAHGAHYVDLTGEIPFVAQINEAYDDRATNAGVKVVQVCGFEAMPPDLAVQLAREAARERWGEDLAEADLEASVVRPPGLPRPTDMVSGGTMQSLAAATRAEDAAEVTDPAALISDPVLAAEVRLTSPISVAPRRGHSGAVVAPMAPAAFINPAVIQRTTQLDAEARLEQPAPLCYREGFALEGRSATLPLRYAAAGALSGVQAAVMAASRARPSVRRGVGGVLTKVLPSSGFGPTGARLEEWKWRMSLVARTTGGREVRVQIDADGHPGYLSTSRILGEAGLMLAEPGVTPQRAGCLTPAAALGTSSIDRFERAGMRFSLS